MEDAETEQPGWGLEEFDVVVVGAGVIGSAAAYHLIRHGPQKVLLLEQASCIDVPEEGWPPFQSLYLP
jgi:2-polyprenyl-6-methoxyphenol hydroxylase-like FAD-dependent oxidoreductase